MSNKWEEQTSNIAKSLLKFGESIQPIITSLADMSFVINQVAKTLSESITPYMRGFSNFSLDFLSTLKEQYDNPDSFFSYLDYEKSLNSFYWAMPYKINSARLKDILTTVNSEIDFDKYMRHYFDRPMMLDMLEEISASIPKKEKTIFDQICKSYWDKEYALINGAIISLIDERLSIFLRNQGSIPRINILKPIINDLDKKLSPSESYVIFILMMLDNNINRIFENISFDLPISITSTKKVRRHTTLHGRLFDNRKTSSIMLFNSLYQLIKISEELTEYYCSLEYSKKTKEYFIVK